MYHGPEIKVLNPSLSRGMRSETSSKSGGLARLSATRHPPQQVHSERPWWVWPLRRWFLRGPLPKCSFLCQRPWAPVSLTKVTTNYPRHVSRAAFKERLPPQEVHGHCTLSCLRLWMVTLFWLLTSIILLFQCHVQCILNPWSIFLSVPLMFRIKLKVHF